MDKEIHSCSIYQTWWRIEESAENHLHDRDTFTTQVSRTMLSFQKLKKKKNGEASTNLQKAHYSTNISCTGCITKLHLRNTSKVTDSKEKFGIYPSFFYSSRNSKHFKIFLNFSEQSWIVSWVVHNIQDLLKVKTMEIIWNNNW